MQTTKEPPTSAPPETLAHRLWRIFAFIVKVIVCAIVLILILGVILIIVFVPIFA